MNEESLFVKLNSSHLHIKRFYKENKGDVVLLLHGAVENGKIFYSKSGKGLAPFLAKNGYDVYVPDLGGRGESYPKIFELKKQAPFLYSQTRSIKEEIPAFLDEIIRIRGEKASIHCIGHSAGGILLMSYFSRFKKHHSRIRSITFFATRRTISIFSLEVLVKVRVFWNVLGILISKGLGYLPAKKLRWGSDDESILSHRQSVHWIKSPKWVDSLDQFDYGSALKTLSLPPTLLFTGGSDFWAGNPVDCKVFLEEIGAPSHSFRFLSKKNGQLVDYDHNNILTHPKAPEDHFLQLLDWFKKTTTKKRDVNRQPFQ